MSDTFIKETITDATFQTGNTLSGSFVVEYNATGAVLGVSDANLVVTDGAATTTITGLTLEDTDVSATTGTHYELRNSGPLTGPIQGIDINFKSETPTHLSVDDYDGLFTSLQVLDSTGQTTASGLVTGGGGTIVDQVVCFFPGTAVTTPTGTVAIEDLTAGDLVMTSEGESQPIRWLGRQTVSMQFADPVRVLPIRIKAGALENAMPARDLLVSPCHALLVDGVLVQAGALVNGVSIIHETNVPETFKYFHIELADHSLILAEGVAAETFIDNIDRLSFDNWAEHDALVADTAPMVEMPLPRAKSHRQVPQQLRQRLQLRAAEAYAPEVAAA